MINQIFKKKQESYAQFCTCSLTSTGIAKQQRGEKFLARLQTQSSAGSVQVNKSKAFGKEKQIKLSLRAKQKKRENTQNAAFVNEIESKTYLRADKQTNFVFKNNQPLIKNLYQYNENQVKSKKQRQQIFFEKQIYPRLELKQIKIDNNIQRYEKPNTQKSTYFSNLTQVKNSIQIVPPTVSSKYLNNNTSISAIKQKEVTEINCLPRSKSFSTNLIGKSSEQNFSFGANQNQTSCNYMVNEVSNHKNLQTQYKLSDLRFKSAESFQEAQNDQYSQLASQNQYLSHPNINEGNWSLSLNQIFIKKMRMLTHNPDA